MTTSLDTLIVPVRYYSALDPYNWKVDNRPLSDLEDNDDVLRSGIETCLNAAKVGAAVDGRLLKALVGPYNAVGYWEPSASGVALEIYNTIKVSTVTDDSHDVDLIAIQYSPAVFALPTPSSGNKVLATIYAKYQLPSTPEMPYYDPTQGLDALGTTVGTLQTKQGNIEFAIATTTVASANPDNYPSPAVGYDTLFNIKVDSTDTVLDPAKIIAVGISTLGQAIAKATTTSYGQVRFATATEVTTGTSTSTVVSPADLKGRIDAIPKSLPGSYYNPGAILALNDYNNPSVFTVKRIGSGRVTIRGTEYLVQEGSTLTPTIDNWLYAVYLSPVSATEAGAIMVAIVPHDGGFGTGQAEPVYDPTYGQVYRFGDDGFLPNDFWPQLFVGVLYKNTLVHSTVFRNMFNYYGRSFLNDRGTFSSGFYNFDGYYLTNWTIDPTSTKTRTQKNGKVNLEAVLLESSDGTATPWGLGDLYGGYPRDASSQPSETMTIQPFEARTMVIGTILFPWEQIEVKATYSLNWPQGNAPSAHRVGMRIWDLEYLKTLTYSLGSVPPSAKGWVLAQCDLENVDDANGTTTVMPYHISRRLWNNEKIAFTVVDAVSSTGIMGTLSAIRPRYSSISIEHNPRGLEHFVPGLL